MVTHVRIAVPDYVSNTMFPLLAAKELGSFEREGLDVEILHAHGLAAVEALRDGRADFSAGPAHAPVARFPQWQGVRLVAALAQGTPWLLVMRSDLRATRGDLKAVIGRRIAAAAGPDFVLRHLLHEAGIDPEKDDVTIAPIPGTTDPGVSFGVAAGHALAEGRADGIWANALGGAVAAHLGGGSLLVDLRRGDGPPGAGNYSFAALATTEAKIETSWELVLAVVRATVSAQRALRRDPATAAEIGKRLFPPVEGALIGEVVNRDAVFYDPTISEATAAALDRFTLAVGLTSTAVPYERVVAIQCRPLWGEER